MDQPTNLPTTDPVVPQHTSAMGPVVVGIIVLGVLLLGGLYVWGAKIEKDRQIEAAKNVSGTDESSPQEEGAAEASMGLPPSPPALPSMEAGAESEAQAL